MTDRRSFLLGLGALAAGAIAGVKKAIPAGWAPYEKFEWTNGVGPLVKGEEYWVYDDVTRSWTMLHPIPEALLNDLRAVEALKTGDPIPEFLRDNNGWGEPLSRLCGRAADLIERVILRADDPREVLEREGGRPRPIERDAARPLQQRREVGI